MNRVIIALFGNVFEFYNFILFALLAKHIAANFFYFCPEKALTFTYIISLCGYLSRPLGSLVLGHISDCYGRTKALSLSVLCTGLASFLIGSLPTTWGLWGIGCLIVLRFMQGFLVSGEEGAVAVYLSEIIAPHRKGLINSLVLSSVFLGILIATAVVGVLNMSFSNEAMLEYGWRLPLVCSLPFSILLFFFRIKLKATLPNSDLIKKRMPITILWEQYARDIIWLIISCALYASLTCFVMVWYPAQSTLLTPKFLTLGLLFMGCMIPVFGWLSDRYGVYRIFLLGMFLGITAIPIAHHYCHNVGGIFGTYIGIFVLYCLISCISGPILLLLTQHFEVTVRCSGTSFIFNTAITLFSGMFPALATVISDKFGVSVVFAYLEGVAVVGTLCYLMYIRKLKPLAKENCYELV